MNGCCDVREKMVCTDIRDWLLSKPRPAAEDAFSGGHQRKLAHHIETAIRHARQDGKNVALEEAIAHEGW